MYDLSESQRINGGATRTYANQRKCCDGGGDCDSNVDGDGRCEGDDAERDGGDNGDDAGAGSRGDDLHDGGDVGEWDDWCAGGLMVVRFLI